MADPLELYRLAFDQARHDLDAQAGLLESIRSRSSGLLGAAAIALGLTTAGQRDALSLAAVAVLVAIGGAVAIIHAPWKWTFAQEVTTLLDELDSYGEHTDVAGILRHRAEKMQTHRHDNRDKLDRLTRVYVAVCVLVPVELLLAVLRLR